MLLWTPDHVDTREGWLMAGPEDSNSLFGGPLPITKITLGGRFWASLGQQILFPLANDSDASADDDGF